MKRIRWYIETSKHGSRCSGEFEVEDGATNDEIDEQAKQEAFNDVNWGWYEGRSKRDA